ncbi:MAG: hypothetical protein Fur0025_27450 [Oscillatoriaceae cyanobacterium]
MKEYFAQAAARHLHDARLLRDCQRWDNAVYLAGYVVECAFKVLVEIYFQKDKAAEKFGHELTKLEGEAIERLRVMYPGLDKQLPASRTAGTVLAQAHPERRYAQSDLWNESQARSAVDRAEDIYLKIIPRLVLDGKISSKEL